MLREDSVPHPESTTDRNCTSASRKYQALKLHMQCAHTCAITAHTEEHPSWFLTCRSGVQATQVCLSISHTYQHTHTHTHSCRHRCNFMVGSGLVKPDFTKWLLCPSLPPEPDVYYHHIPCSFSLSPFLSLITHMFSESFLGSLRLKLVKFFLCWPQALVFLSCWPWS